MVLKMLKHDMNKVENVVRFIINPNESGVRKISRKCLMKIKIISLETRQKSEVKKKTLPPTYKSIQPQVRF